MSLSVDAAAILGGEFYRWNLSAPLGTSPAVTFSFGSSLAGYDNTTRTGFTPLSAGQQASMREALNVWGAVSGLVFIEVPESLGGSIR